MTAKRGLVIGLMVLAATGICSNDSFSVSEPIKDVKTITSSPKNSLANDELNDKLNKISMPFIANKGQISEDVLYYAPTLGGTVFVTRRGEIVYALPKVEELRHTEHGGSLINKRDRKIMSGGIALKETFVGANISKVSGYAESKAIISHFTGNNPARRQSGIKTYETIGLGEIYEGIELKLGAYGRTTEKLFYVRPQAEPAKIKIKVEGATALKVNNKGELEAETELGTVRFTKPLAFQEIAPGATGSGQREFVAVEYVVSGNEYSFRLGKYDKSRTVVIDPLLASTLIGGSDYDAAKAMVLDSAGNVYIAGATWSQDYPVVPGSFKTSPTQAIFISKLNADLNSLLASTYIGDGAVTSIAKDSAGNIFIAGITQSPIYPVTQGAYQTSIKGGYDFFISKLDANLSALLASTLLGGSEDEGDVNNFVKGPAAAVDAQDNILITGMSMSDDFPAAGGVISCLRQTCITKINNNLSTLLASNRIAYTYGSYANAIATNQTGEVYITGSAWIPISDGHYNWITQVMLIAKFSGDLSSLLADRTLSSHDSDEGLAIAINQAGEVYAAGYTESLFPTTPGAYNSIPRSGGSTVFVTKWSSDLSELLASTLIGGDRYVWDRLSLAIDASGAVYIAGSVEATDYPTTPDGYQTAKDGNIHTFVSKMDSGLSFLLASTFVGGSQEERGYAMALDSTGSVYIAGGTYSSDYPTTAGALKTVNTGGEAFVSKLDANLSATGCSLTLSQKTASFTGEGGNGNIAVTASSANCAWTAASNLPWITVTSGGSGTGNGTVVYSVAENTGALPRTGALAIGGQVVSITQGRTEKCRLSVSTLYGDGIIASADGILNCGPVCSAMYKCGNAVTLYAIPNNGSYFYVWGGDISCGGTAACSFSLANDTTASAAFQYQACVSSITPTGAAFGSSGGSDSIKITAALGCPWTVSNKPGWVTLTSASSGNGSGTVIYTVSANTGTSTRSAAMTVAERTFTVTQSGTKQYSLTVSKSGTGSGTVTSSDAKIKCGAACSANYSSGTTVTLIASPGSGSVFTGWSGGCSGTGSCVVDVNAAASVTAAFAPASCTYFIDSSSASFGSDAGTESVKITTQSGCAWSVTNGLSWVTVTSGSSGTGSGTMKYSVAANTGTTSRSGSMTIAGNAFLVNQAAGSGGPFGYTFCSNENAHCTFTGTKQVAFGSGGKFVYKSFSNGVDCNTTKFGDPNPGAAKACYIQNTACTFAIEPTSKALAAGSDTGTIAVTASSSSCSRTAKSNVSWVSITAGSSGKGNGTVSYSVSANTGTGLRTGTITVAGQTFTVTQDGIKQYTLSALKSGMGSGTVKSSDSKINCGTVCSAAYNSGTSVTLTATANSGSTFSGWSGAGCSGTGTCPVSITASTEVIAVFSTPSCITGIAPASKTYDERAASDTIAVTASSGSCTWTASSSVPWATVTAGGSGTGNGTVSFSLAANTTATARTGSITFSGKTFSITQTGTNQIALNVFRAGTGNGTITSSDSKINCGSLCSAAYNPGQAVLLTANPAVGSAFISWGGACSGSGNCVMPLNADAAVTATFQTCTMNISPVANQFTYNSGSGTAAVNASAGSCGWTAVSNAPWITVTSGVSGTGNGTVSYAIAANTDVNARTGTIYIAGQTFTVSQSGAPQYTLTISKSGAGSGVVTSADSAINCGSACSANYKAGTSITLTATPATGFTFTGWTGGGCIGTDACIISLAADAGLDARFEIPITLTITSPADGTTQNSGAVTVTGTVENAPGVESGVTVNGVPAVIQGNQFSVDIPLAIGQNLIAAVATDSYGHAVTKQITVNRTPAISSLAVDTITATGARIVWKTDVPADSTVEYGPTQSYGSQLKVTVLSAEHTMALEGLSRDTVYHFRVSSRAGQGETAVSGDTVFTTAKNDFTAKFLGDYGNVAVIEVTGDYEAKNPDGLLNVVPRQVITKEYLKTHADTSDFIVIFSNFDFTMPETDARAYYMGIKNDVSGIGIDLFDSTALFGSSGKLQGLIEMGSITKHTLSPADPDFGKTLLTLGHEKLHRWGAHVKFREQDGTISSALLGLDGEHWSFLLDSDGSLLYGNDWKDNGNGSFTSVSAMNRYSRLDLYLMGVKDKTAVSPMMLIDSPIIDPTRLPETGVTVSGASRLVTIDDIIAVEGERAPDVASSQKTFRISYILITRPGTFTGNEVSGIENVRNAWAAKFNELTEGQASVEGVEPTVMIEITSPLDGATVSSPYVMVRGGVINSSGLETGVTINGMPAAAYGTQFTLSGVQLVEGQNTLTVKATDTAGHTATKTITVTRVSTGHYIQLTANPGSGVAPMQTTLRINGSFTVNSPEITVAGPSPVEMLTSTNPDEYVYRLPSEGIYYFTAKATGPDGMIYQDTIPVTVMNKDELDKLLKAKWEGMTNSLKNGDISSALAQISTFSRPAYQQMFNALGAQLPAITATQTGFNLISIKNGIAKYELVTSENGQTYAYDVIFAPDTNGIWMIQEY